MRIADIMSRDVELINPGQSIREAAQRMKKVDSGALPVGEGERLVGMITDRDIAVRAIAEGKGPQTKVRDAMTPT